jgi:multidrug efflux pump subunit AcrA (membrane-fusion protein)
VGIWAKIGFSEGAVVKSGDVLFIIDQRPYQAALDQAQANLEQAKAQLALAQSNYERSDQLHKTGVIDQQQYDTDVANRNVAYAFVLASQRHWKLPNSTLHLPRCVRRLMVGPAPTNTRSVI